MPKKKSLREKLEEKRLRAEEERRSVIKTATPKQLKHLKIQTCNDYIPIREIKDGIICTKDDRYIKIIEIEPVNFTLLSDREQNATIMAFASWLKIAPGRLHFKCVTTRADPIRHIGEVMEEAKATGDETTVAIAQNYSELVQSLSLDEALSRRFFIMLESENRSRTPRWDEVRGELENMAATAQNYLIKCGNSVLFHEDESRFVLEVLYLLFNRRMAAQYSLQTYLQFSRRQVDMYNAKHPEAKYEPSDLDLVVPKSIDFTSGKHTIVDGLYYAYLYLDCDEGYNTVVDGSWLYMLVNAGDGIDLDLFAREQDKSAFLNRLGNRIARNRASTADYSEANAQLDQLESAVESALFLKESIVRNNETVYYMSTVITVTADTQANLEWRVNELKKMLKAMDMSVRECTWQQEQGFKTVIPINYIDKEIYTKSRRNILTYGLAASYIFTAFELRDDGGVLYGVNRLNNSICTVDVFNTHRHSNANIAILGRSGAGKTFLLQLMASRFRMRGIQTFILAPDKGQEFLRFCKRINGTFVKISPGSRQCINVLEIRKLDKSNDALIEGAETFMETESSRLSQKISQLHVFFSLLIPDMSYEEIQLLDEALMETYRRKGITEDNRSLIDPVTGDYKTMPILGDLHEVLKESPDTRRLSIILNRLVHGSASSFNNQTNVDTRNPYVVIDLSELADDLKPVGMFIGLEYIWDVIKEDRTRRKAVFIDECWQLIGEQSNKVAADFVVGIFKKIRAYAGSAICATQDLNDFFSLDGGKYGKAIINNSQTKIVLGLDPAEAATVQDTMQLTDNETSSIITAQRGEALFCTNGCRVAIKVKASSLEQELITTDREDLLRIIKGRQQGEEDINAAGG